MSRVLHLVNTVQPILPLNKILNFIVDSVIFLSSECNNEFTNLPCELILILNVSPSNKLSISSCSSTSSSSDAENGIVASNSSESLI